MWRNKRIGFGMGIELVKIKARLSPLDTPTKDKLRVCYVGEDYHMYLPNVSSRSTSTYNDMRACIDPNIDTSKVSYKIPNITPNISPNKDANIDPNNIYKADSVRACMRVYEVNKGKTKEEIFGDRYCCIKEPGKEFNLENFVLYCREYIYTGAMIHRRVPYARAFNYEALSYYNNQQFNLNKVRKSFGSLGFNGEIGICPAGEYTYIYVTGDSMYLDYYTTRLKSKHTMNNIGMCEVWADFNRDYIIYKLLQFFNITEYTKIKNTWVGVDVFGNELNFDYHTGLGRVCIVNTDNEIKIYSGQGKDTICKADKLDENAKLEGVLPKLFTYSYNNNIQYEYDNKVKHYQPKELRRAKTKKEILRRNVEKGKLKPKKPPKGKNAPSLKKNPRHDKYHYIPVRNNPYHLTSIQLQHRRERLKAYWDKVNSEKNEK